MSQPHNPIEMHRKLKGKLRVMAADSLDTEHKLSSYYTPGVGAVSSAIAKDPSEARELTGIGNTVAVVSDGTAVLGLGNIGPLAALPVMEGKAMLFREFAGINAFPLVLGTTDPEKIIAAVKAIAPGFGGINLEDIAAPACFEIENRLKAELDIPVFHDDQHGTAIVVLAGLINAAKVVDKDLKHSKAVVVGAGAAGSAVAKLMVKYGIEDVIVTDRQGVIYAGREGLRADKAELAGITNPRRVTGSLEAAVAKADIIVGVSGPGSISAKHVKAMANSPIVFALSNPTPEILPEVAHAAGAAIIATGRSDFPNQVNNALVFPALFRGALDNRVTQITDAHKLNAASALAKLVGTPDPENIIPIITDGRILKAISSVVV